MENSENNRDYMRNNDCQYIPQGINAAFGYNTAQALSDDMNCCNSCNQAECMNNRNRVREEMMKQIKCLSFAIVDIWQNTLDTHPKMIEKLLCLHREYCNQLEEIKDKYQKIFGPLSYLLPMQ